MGAGTLASASGAVVRFPHRWTPAGVTVEAEFTGGHLLHLAAAGCVLNDVYREAAALGIGLTGVRVTAAGGFDTSTWQSTGIDYAVEVSSDAPAGQLARLLEAVDRDSAGHPGRNRLSRPSGRRLRPGWPAESRSTASSRRAS